MSDVFIAHDMVCALALMRHVYQKHHSYEVRMLHAHCAKRSHIGA